MSNKKLRLLILEDELSIAKILGIECQELGYDVQVVSSVAEANGVFQSAECWVDIALVDLKLPDGNGMDVVKIIKATHPKMPIIMMTGHGNKATIVEALKLGVYDYLEKPFSLESDLFPALQRLSREIALETENDRLTEQMLHSEKLVAIGELAAIVLHDVRGPISAILLACEEVEDEIAAKGVLENKAAVAHLADVRKALARISNLVDHLRVFSRNDDHEATAECSLSTLLEDSLYLVQHKIRRLKINVEVSIDATFKNASVLCVANRIEQMLMNLCSNACDAMVECAKKELRISVVADGEWMKISVSDTGVGMSEEIVAKIFNSFFTTKSRENGTGLGMKIVQDVALQHGAEITIQSKEGSGSIFSIRIPLSRVCLAKNIESASEVA